MAALIGILSGAIFMGSGMLGSNRLRAAGSLITSGIRLGISRANTTGKPVRLVFDLESDRVRLEEATGRMLREKDENDSTGAGAEPATEAENDAREAATTILDGPRAPRARFSPVKEFTDDDGFGRPLGRGIKFRQVQTEHDGKPREEGRAYLYMWPGGQTERASIQLYRAGDDEGITILVSPLTGRAQMKRGQLELDAPDYEVDWGEREE